MRVSLAYRTYDPSAGGPPTAVLGLGRSLADLGLEIDVHNFEARYVPPPDQLGSCRLVTATPIRTFDPAYLLGVPPVVENAFSHADVVHLSGLWGKVPFLVHRLHRRLQFAYVVSLHGVLEPTALSHHAWRKQTARWLYTDRLLNAAGFVHAMTRHELDLARAYGFRGPIAVIPNGVALPPVERAVEDARFAEWFPQLARRPYVLYLGRLHREKGLDQLVDAWGQQPVQGQPWALAVVGPPDPVEYAQRLEEIVRDRHLTHSVFLLGPQYGERKAALLEHASIFALPSLREGQSVALLEAMSYAVPLLYSTGCNFAEAARSGAGLEVAPQTEAIAEGLGQLIGKTETERAQMGALGRAYVEVHHAWPVVASKMVAAYRWMLGRGERPGFVELT